MKKRHMFLMLVLYLPICCLAQGQDTLYSKEWKLGLGYQNYRILDKNVSPLIYVANNVMVAAHLEKNVSKGGWGIAASFSLGNNQSKRFGQRESVVYDDYSIDGKRDSTVYTLNPSLSFLQASLSYSHLWRVKNGQNEMYVGIIIGDVFKYGALGADVWFFNYLGVSPSFRAQLLKTSKSSLKTEASAPILSYLVRQPYTLDPSLPIKSYFLSYVKTGSTFGSIHNFQQINLSLAYDYRLVKGGGQIGLTYCFTWMNVANIPNRNLRAYSNSLLVSYIF